ncbi:MAG: hypothetical protein V2I65_03495, partial [Paracoccaceae bacterium]|nr:hypothetical protein [Paracoccaceae bacterium]
MNFCKNPACANFGIPALARVSRGRPRKDGSGARDRYQVGKPDRGSTDRKLRCLACNRESSIKSNRAVAEEQERISRYLLPPDEPSCPSPGCSNAGVGVYSNTDAYRSKGTRRGSWRLLCRQCHRLFSVRERPHVGQKKPHENKTVFREIVSKKPIRGIALVSDLSPKAVYDKIDFIHAQCVGFIGERERRASGIRRKYVRLCVDRQDYLINWQSRQNRKNVQFSSSCTVEGKTGYVIAHNLNYDPNVNRVDINDAAKAAGDLLPGSKSYFRIHAQYWLRDEFRDIADRSSYDLRPDPDSEPMLTEDLILEKERERLSWPRSEMADYPCRGNQMPPDGVMTHLDYTAYAHARLVRRLIGRPDYITIYCDQDEVLRGAFMAAFAAEMRMDQVEMAYVQFQKHMDIDEKRLLANACKPHLAALSATCNCNIEKAISRKMGLDYAKACLTERDWRRRWIEHPRDTMNEPRRKILYLSDTGRKSLIDIGWTLSGASLAPVDNYFMRLRRKVSSLERPIPS